MNRQTRTLIVMAVALAAAAAAAFGVYTALSRAALQQTEAPTGQTVVAARTLPLGTMLKPEDVRLVPWPKAVPLSGAFETVDAVAGRGLVSPVVENEPIVESKLAPRESGAGLPPSIPPGMRAMSVKVNEVIGVAGFVIPGTRVDVMVVLRRRDDGAAKTVVGNVQVLTAGTRTDQESAKDGKPIPSTVVTLLVSPDDAEKIALAQSEGQLMLSLRNPTDVAPTETLGVRTPMLLGAASHSEPPAPAPAPAPRARKPAAVVAVDPAPAPKVYVVEAIRAAKRTEEPVR